MKGVPKKKCWNCNGHIKPINNVLLSGLIQVVRAECVDCGQFWVLESTKEQRREREEAGKEN